jgi:starvation-inducible DNA-binding protein
MTNQVVEALNKLLANNYALYLKTQNFHWNVTGPNFKTLHLLFEEQYNDLLIANDEIAERIRALGVKVPATFLVFSKNTDIKDGREDLAAVDMVKELAADQLIIIKSLKQVMAASNVIGDEVTAGYVIERIGVHEKASWMLNSSI